LSSSDAIFASSLFGATAIEHDNPVAARTACLIALAARRARCQGSSVIAGSGDAARGVVGRRHTGQVDVDLIDAAILDFGRDRAHGGLEQP
jgi:hypothetical protein